MAPSKDKGITPEKQRKTKLVPVSPSCPCPVCGGDHKCSTSEDGLIFCGRKQGHLDGFKCLGPARGDPMFCLYRRQGDGPDQRDQPLGESNEGPVIDWGRRAEVYQDEGTETNQCYEEFHAALGLPPGLFHPAFLEPMVLLGVGWDPESGCWTLPERDSHGGIIGINRRYPDGRKRVFAGGKRELYYNGLRDLSGPGDDPQARGPILLPEGFSDVLVLEALGIATVGRPSNTSGAELLVEYLGGLPEDRTILVLGENDRKADGAWPGREGAEATAVRLSHGLRRPVSCAFPPGAKDVREWFLGQDLAHLQDEDWPATRQTLREELLGALLESARGESGWEAPLPLHSASPPPFPVHALAPWQVAFAEAEATATQTPPDLAGMLLLSATSAACAKKVVVRVKEGYLEPVNLYTATALPPASRKSAVFRDVTAPILQFERELVAGRVAEAAETRARLAIDSKTLEELSKKAAKAQAGERETLVEQAGEQARKLAAAEVPGPGRVLTDDTTPERLEALLAENGGAMGIFSAEGGVFDIMAGRYAAKGRSGNFEVYLKGHAGDTLRVDRMNRPPVFIRAPALTLGLAVQPHVVRSLGDIPGSRGRGLLARILYAMPASTVGRRVVDPPPVPEATGATFRGRMRSLLELAAGTDEDGQIEEHVLVLTDAAYGRWLGFAAWVEPQLAAFGPLAEMADWAGKLPGAVARIAGLLHMADRAGETAPWGSPIPPGVMDRAVTIGHYLIPHAREAFALMGCDPRIEDARYVLAWLGRRTGAAAEGVASFSKRDAFEGTKGRFPQVTDLEPALALLERHNYIRLRPAEARPGRGRPPSPTYDINPLGVRANPLGFPRPPGLEAAPSTPVSANCANPANQPDHPENNASSTCGCGEDRPRAGDPAPISAHCANTANSSEISDPARAPLSANCAHCAIPEFRQDEAAAPEPDGGGEDYEEGVI